MTAPENAQHRDNCYVAAAIPSRAVDDVHTCRHIYLAEGCKPLNIGERIWEMAEMGWKCEYNTDLGRSKA